jgi:hypothetical protein
VAVAALWVALATPAWSRPRAPVATWPRPEVLDLAVRAHRCGQAAGLFENPLLTVIDYSLPSTERRLWVIDLVRRRILFHELVAHGERSGERFAVSFSNRPRSRQSSLGLFRTEDVYLGRHGLSLRLSGLEPGVNDRAMERAIVMHGADYVSPSVVAAIGRLGRSWGCPALDRAVNRPLIERIKGGAAVFAYYPERRWLRESRFLRCEGRLALSGERGR